MRKVIYTKYSNQRKKEYKISTSIISDDGLRSVIKQAIYDEGRGHVLKMEKTGEYLAELYAESGFHVAKCIEMTDKAIEMEFVEGETLEKIFNDYISNAEFDKLFEFIKNFSDKLYSNSKLKNFNNNPLFENIFGNVGLSDTLKAFDISNLDMIFSNFICNNSGMYVIDYEWVFDFQIPIEFIMFRSLFHNAFFQGLDNEIKDKIYGLLNITKSDRPFFEQMEYAFQEYVKGENNDFAEIYERIGQNVELFDSKGGSKAYNYSLYLGKEKIISKKTIQSEIKIDINCDKSNDDFKLYLNDKNGIYKLSYAIGSINGVKEQLKIIDSNCSLDIIDDYYYTDNNPFMVFGNKGYDAINIGYSILESDNRLMHNLVDALIREHNQAVELSFYNKIGANNLYKIGEKIKGVSKK